MIYESFYYEITFNLILNFENIHMFVQKRTLETGKNTFFSRRKEESTQQ